MIKEVEVIPMNKIGVDERGGTFDFSVRDSKDFGMAQNPPVLVNIMHAGFYPNVLSFGHECYDSIVL